MKRKSDVFGVWIGILFMMGITYYISIAFGFPIVFIILVQILLTTLVFKQINDEFNEIYEIIQNQVI